MNLPYLDLFKAFRIFPIGIEHIENFVEKLKDHKLYEVINSAINSDRKPQTVKIFSDSVGMIIPEKYRYGILTYQYFLENVFDYSTVKNKKFSSVYIHAVDDPKKYLKMFRDDILMKIFNIKDFDFDSREHFIDYIFSNLKLVSLPCMRNHDDFKCFLLNDKYTTRDKVDLHMKNISSTLFFMKNCKNSLVA